MTNINNILVCSFDEQLLPVKWTSGSVCWDVKCRETFSIAPWKIIKVWTGIKTFLPQGRGTKMYARSSLPTKVGLMSANNVAIFDSDFRGEYLMQLYNFTSEVVRVPAFTRLMQLEFFPYLRGERKFWWKGIPWLEMKVDVAMYDDFAMLFPSERGAGGIGSTG
jgi:dUTPase